MEIWQAILIGSLGVSLGFILGCAWRAAHEPQRRCLECDHYSRRCKDLENAVEALRREATWEDRRVPRDY